VILVAGQKSIGGTMISRTLCQATVNPINTMKHGLGMWAKASSRREPIRTRHAATLSHTALKATMGSHARDLTIIDHKYE
jgi:hypothetical protein